MIFTYLDASHIHKHINIALVFVHKAENIFLFASCKNDPYARSLISGVQTGMKLKSPHHLCDTCL